MKSETGHDLYENGQRPHYDNQTKLDGVYIASKSKFSEKSPVHRKQLEQTIPPGWCIETWRDGELVEILDPEKYLTVDCESWQPKRGE